MLSHKKCRLLQRHHQQWVFLLTQHLWRAKLALKPTITSHRLLLLSFNSQLTNHSSLFCKFFAFRLLLCCFSLHFMSWSRALSPRLCICSHTNKYTHTHMAFVMNPRCRYSVLLSSIVIRCLKLYNVGNWRRTGNGLATLSKLMLDAVQKKIQTPTYNGTTMIVMMKLMMMMIIIIIKMKLLAW